MIAVVVVMAALIGVQAGVIYRLASQVHGLNRDQEDTLQWVRREMVPRKGVSGSP